MSIRELDLENRNPTTPMTAVLGRLEGVKKTRKGYMARCPAHDDRSPSLSVHEGRNGAVLLWCWAGCDREDVRKALGFEWSDLFPDDDRRVRPRRRLRAVAQEESVALPASVAEILLDSADFALSWEMAKALAEIDPALAKQRILDGWDEVSDRMNIPAAWELAGLLRGIATFRYGEQLSKCKPSPEFPDDAYFCDDGRVLRWTGDWWERIGDLEDEQTNPLDIGQCVRLLIEELER